MEELLRKIDGLANVLSGAGVSFTDYIAQLTYLLFLKMDDEKKAYPGLTNYIPKEYSWSELERMNGTDLLEKYESILLNLKTQQGIIGSIFAGADNKIQSPVYLRKLIEMINENNWYIMEGDIKGAIYEKLLQKNGQDMKSGAGQYFTPRPLVRAIINCVKPKITETVHDPACGTGGFLLEAYNYMRRQSKDIDELSFLRERAITGSDNTPIVVTLASMNLFLHDIGGDNSPIKHEDSLIDRSDSMFDIIVANPPFGKRARGSIDVSSIRQDFFPSQDNQVNFLQHIMSKVKMGGRAGVIIPDSVLDDRSNSTKRVRKKLLEEFNLHTILRLPTGIFYAQGVQTNVLFFEKGQKTENIWIYDYRTGIKHTLVTKPLKEDNLQDFVEKYNQENRIQSYDADKNPNGRWRCFSAKEILCQEDINLNIHWINEEVNDDRTAEETIKDIKEESHCLSTLVEKLEASFNNTSCDTHQTGIIENIKGLIFTCESEINELEYKIIERYLSGSMTNECTWTTTPLKEVLLQAVPSQNRINKTQVEKDGLFPVVGQSEQLIEGRCSFRNKVFEGTPVVAFGDHNRNVKYIDFPFVALGDGVKFFYSEKILPKYLYYIVKLEAKHIRNRGYNRHFSLLKNQIIKYPPKNIQQEIIDKLDELLSNQ